MTRVKGDVCLFLRDELKNKFLSLHDGAIRKQTGGLEPPTSRGATSCARPIELRLRATKKTRSVGPELNRRPTDLKSVALPVSYPRMRKMDRGGFEPPFGAGASLPH